MLTLLIIIFTFHLTNGDMSQQELQFLNELPLEKLVRLKNSLEELVTTIKVETNETVATTPYYENFGAQALALKTPYRRTDYEDSDVKKHGYSKISNIFSMSVTTLAFLAFGGYLLCLIVQAVKQNQSQQPSMPQTTTVLVNSLIKKRPQSQFTYGRRRREETRNRSHEVDLPPEELFTALLRLCEGYAKWSEAFGR